MTRPIPTCEFALYSLSGPNAADSEPFSPECYSWYKYGSVRAAETFARALAAAFCAAHPDLARAPRLLLTSSPYARVPAAATTLARAVQPVLNAARAQAGLPPAPLLQVDRASVAEGDYGTLAGPARDQLMAGNDLSFRRFPAGQVRDAYLLVIDDLRVTGAHQRCLLRASADLPLAGRAFLYIAAFASPLTGFDPTVEDALNHAAVKTLDDLAALVEAGDFAWNVRVCKFVLSRADRAELRAFLRRMPGWFVRDLHRHSDRDGYARMSAYAAGHAAVGAELSRRPGALAARQPA